MRGNSITVKTEYKKGDILIDNDTKETFKVLKCESTLNGSFKTTFRKQNQHLEYLKKALKSVKMHDKDLFMLENIVSSLEESI